MMRQAHAHVRSEIAAGKLGYADLPLRNHYADQNLLFASRTGQPLRQSNLQGPFKALLASAGLPDMRQYDLRHSCATLLLAAGESPKVVADR